MFDAIGTTHDAEASRRGATSAGLTTLLVAAAVGFSAGVGLLRAAAPPAPAAEDGDLVFLDAPPEPVEVLLPPAPPARAGNAGEDEAPTPEDPATPAPLSPDPDPEVRDARPAAGTPDGVPDGRLGGDPEGVGTAECPDCPAQPRSRPEPRQRVDQELHAWRKIDPLYPRAARALGLGRVSCRVDLVVDRRGVPRDVEVLDCPVVFHESARSAVLKWRWDSPRDAAGERVEARTRIVIHYDVR